MPFIDNKPNKDLTIEACIASDKDWRIWINCPNMYHDPKDTCGDSERYICDKCNRVQYAYYDDMR